MVFCPKCDANHSHAACVEIEPRKAYDIRSDDFATYRVAIFSRAAVEAAYGPVTPDNAEDTAAQLTGWHESYRGPGRSFSTGPSIRVLGRNIVVRQFCGLDI